MKASGWWDPLVERKEREAGGKKEERNRKGKRRCEIEERKGRDGERYRLNKRKKRENTNNAGKGASWWTGKRGGAMCFEVRGRPNSSARGGLEHATVKTGWLREKGKVMNPDGLEESRPYFCLSLHVVSSLFFSNFIRLSQAKRCHGDSGSDTRGRQIQRRVNFPFCRKQTEITNKPSALENWMDL